MYASHCCYVADVKIYLFSVKLMNILKDAVLYKPITTNVSQISQILTKNF